MKINEKLVGHAINGLKITRYFKATTDKARDEYFFEFICRCGKTRTAECDSIKSGKTRSCGCLTHKLIAQSKRLPGNQAQINKLWKKLYLEARRKNLEFEITKELVKSSLTSPCVLCGKSYLKEESGKGEETEFNEIALLSPEQGYTLNNCITVCSECKSRLAGKSVDALQAWIKRIIKNNNQKKNLGI